MRIYTPLSARQVKQLYKAAAITSPLIALMLSTPAVLLARKAPTVLLWAVPLLTFFIFIAWVIQIQMIRKIRFTKQRYRFYASSLVMITASFIVYYIFPELFPFHGAAFHITRTVNILSVNGVVYIISNYILLIYTQKQLSAENEQLKFANLEARYQILQNQVNPHFLFNSLGTAKSLIRKNPAIADEYLVKLSDFLRIGFQRKNDIVTVKQELALCRDYIALQQMRFGEALHFYVHISDEKYQQYRMPYFALLTLVENAVKHNSLTEAEPLTIQVSNTGDTLIVENNIQKRFLLEDSTRMGLNNLSERYRLLFNEPVVIEEQPATFRVTLKMMHP
ncbi:sensor histidine kinase [Deminuibacter soli]|uniref:Signal transduction histidine kinase internal region domain-containing protein n=1 Tax=Deminuibacter soli TaxID=2291815 RepID=A0A3E1NGX9_9BACT|nr:histidine kinase [Deminuibacter soli]RFM27147.1 hypothetical protein DXN05_16950 [Deminuibacter soli]